MHILIMMPIKSKHMIMLVNYIKDGVSPAIQKLLDITHQKNVDSSSQEQLTIWYYNDQIYLREDLSLLMYDTFCPSS